MINANAPMVPNQGIDFVDRPSGGQDVEAVQSGQSLFAPRWYRFFNDVANFLSALRNAPQQVKQADLSQFAAKLGSKTGVQVWVVEFNHQLRWDGSSWTFAPGDPGSGFTATFLSPPTAAGWLPCDGSVVDFLRADGTIGTQVLPNTPGDYFRT